jgi:hypothetical protein
MDNDRILKIMKQNVMFPTQANVPKFLHKQQNSLLFLHTQIFSIKKIKSSFSFDLLLQNEELDQLRHL